MDEIFRFMLMRPADRPDEAEVAVLAPVELDRAQGAGAARRQAGTYLASGHAVRRSDELEHGALALAVRALLATGPRPRADVEELVDERTGGSLHDLLGTESFGTEEGALADTLVATKLVSASAGSDARGLAAVAQGFDALRRAAEAADGSPVGLRPLAMPTFGEKPAPDPSFPTRHVPPTERGGAPSSLPDRQETEAERELAQVEATIADLRRLRAADFRAPAPAGVQGDESGPAASRGERAAPTTAGTVATWRLEARAVERLRAPARSTLSRLDVSLESAGLPVALQTLAARREELLGEVERVRLADSAARRVTKIGSSFLANAPVSGYVGTPGTAIPTGHGAVHPVGIGDLLLVKQHVLRYEGGEIAHVENVLRSEHLSRETRRLDRTETTVLEESETTTEQERDTQTTDRFSLKRETEQTLHEESELKAGVAVTAKYGPFVEVKANADFATKSSSDEATKQASELSKDVVARSVSRVTDRVLQRRSTTTTSEFEERYSHGLDNTAGDANISGVYQWVDKVLQAQVYDYGKRMLFDLTLPEPGTAFVVAQSTDAADDGQHLVEPAPFTLRADQINEGNYRLYAQRYDVTGLEAPPEPFRTLSKPYDGVLPEDPHEQSTSEQLSIDDGYRARFAYVSSAYYFYGGAVWAAVVGSTVVDVLTGSYVDMDGEVGTVSISFYSRQVRQLAATVQIFCERTERAMQTWQLKAHAAIVQGYLAKQQAYESALAEAAAQAGVVVTGRNPGWNRRIATTELRKQALTLLTAQHFDAFGALELSPQGYPQPSLARAQAQMPYVRFFEQAFEWEHLAYFYYPYFWGWKPAWGRRMLLDDVDPEFADFLRAGAARVVFPVRPGFEAAVAHYLETGEIWDGGQAPDVSDPLYVPILKEIQEAQGAPGAETPHGEPWLVRLPTTLVALRQDDALPSWTKVGEDWQPVA
ncbi:hypothetical protein EDF32_1869 [Cellulomonas sp. PhB143]|nr:hypothetical protein EDF32_1869 [Cellulomonas sp. PhB143]